MNPRKAPCICGSGLEYRKCCEKKGIKNTRLISRDQLLEVIRVLDEEVLHLCMAKLDDTLEKMIDDLENEITKLVAQTFSNEGKKALQHVLKTVPDPIACKKIEYFYITEFPKTMFCSLMKITTNVNEQKQSIYQNAPYKISFDEDFVTAENQFEIEQGFVRYIGKDSFVKIPTTIHGEKVIGVAEGGFSSNTIIQAVFLPETITQLADRSFTDCTNLIHIELNEGLIEIGKHVFNGCHSLRFIQFPESLEVIDSYAFNECASLVRVEFPKQLTHIGAFAFSETSLRYVELPEGLTFIANAAFSECTELEFVWIPEGVEAIYMNSFAYCVALRHVILPKTIQSIHASAFASCYHIKQLLIPNTLKELAPNAFLDIHPHVQIYTPLSKITPMEIAEIIPFPQQHKTKALKTFFKTKNWNILKEDEYKQKAQHLLEEVRNMYHIILGLKQPKGPSLETQYMAMLDQGIVKKRAGQYEQAKQSYIEAIRLLPTRSVAYYNLGKVLYILGDYHAAAKSYRTALQSEHEVEETMHHLGHALLDETVSPEERHIVQFYLQQIAPAKNLKFKIPTMQEIDLYDKKCVDAATDYINSLV